MDKETALKSLAKLTSLKPGKGASDEGLDSVRRLMSQFLLREESDEILSALADEDIFGLPDKDDAPLAFDEPLLADLKNLVSRESESLGDDDDLRLAFPRVFRRSVPFVSASSPNSKPTWAVGRAIDRTLGPFYDEHGRPYWFDVYKPLHQVQVVAAPGDEVLLSVPLRFRNLRSAAKYTLPKGSVWLRSKLMASGAPQNGYTGLRIKKGTLQFSSAPSVIGGKLVVSAGAKIILEIELDPPAATSPASGAGADAGKSKCEPPAKAKFRFSTTTGELTKADDAACEFYGNRFNLTRAAQPATYQPYLNRLLLPFDMTEQDVKMRSVQSNLFTPRGSTKTTSGDWALPVAITPPDSLGQAAGAGGVLVRTKAGLRANWRGLSGGSVYMDETWVLTVPDRLEVLAGQAAYPGLMHKFDLWQTGQPGSVPSLMELHFPGPFPLHFISVSAEAEALLFMSEMKASLDRPILANGQRISISAPKARVILWQDKDGYKILLLAELQQTSVLGGPFLGHPIALTNALLKVMPPQGIVVYGSLPQPNDIRPGALLLAFFVLSITPTLRDPYVTNLGLPKAVYDFAGASITSHLEVPSAVARLLAAVTWQTSQDPKLVMHLLPLIGGALSWSNVLTMAAGTMDAGGTPPEPTAFGTESSGGGFRALSAMFVANTGYIDPTVAKEQDEQAEQGLRNIFEETAGYAREQVVLLDVSSNIDQLGVGFGISARDEHKLGSALPFNIQELDLVSLTRNLRVFLLPQFQWETVYTIQNPDVGLFPSPVASRDDGGPTVIGTQSVSLVPVAPEKIMGRMIEEYEPTKGGVPVAALFTLPFGMKAAARFEPKISTSTSWANLEMMRPHTADDRFTGGHQLAAIADASTVSPTTESPHFPGAAYQTRNLIDPNTNLDLGLSVLSATLNPTKSPEAYFNQEMGPAGSRSRVPVVRIDFSGYGASTFSDWANPMAVSAVSQVRFDVMVGRTAYEVVQISSVLYFGAVPVVRSITFERHKEGRIFRADSGWMPTGPGIYLYPDRDLGADPPPLGWAKPTTHPGVVSGVYNVRRIRETGRSIVKEFPVTPSVPGGPTTERVELIEVRFDGDFLIKDVISGKNDDGYVTGCDHIGFIQKLPTGYTVMPEHLEAILKEEGPVGGPVDCVLDVGGSGQIMRVGRVDVAAAPTNPPNVPHLAAAARGALDLPGDGAWTMLRQDLSQDEPSQVNQDTGVPLIQAGSSGGDWNRFAEPADLHYENSPQVEFMLVQSSEGHQAMFPRPKIKNGRKKINSTEKPLLTDAYGMSVSASGFAKRGDCFIGDQVYQLKINSQGRYTLGPSSTMNFKVPPAIGTRRMVNTSSFAVQAEYTQDFVYKLNPAAAQTWSVNNQKILTSVDLGPFSEMMGFEHDYRVGDGQPPELYNPETKYSPLFEPIVEILQFLARLVGGNDTFAMNSSSGSFMFSATLNLEVLNPGSIDGYLELGPLKLKGSLLSTFGYKEQWYWTVGIGLGTKVLIQEPIWGRGEALVTLAGTEMTGYTVTITLKFGADIPIDLRVVQVQGYIYFGIQVIITTDETTSVSSWQIGLLIGMSGTVNIWVLKVTVKIEFLAAIKRITPPPGEEERCEALGYVLFALEVSVCWFLTISVSYSIEFKEEVDI